MPEVKPRYAKVLIERKVTVAEQEFQVAFSLAGISVSDRRALGSLNEMDDEAGARAEARMLAHAVDRWDVEVGGEVVPLTEDDIFAKLNDEWIDAMLGQLFEASSWGKAVPSTDDGKSANSPEDTSSAPPTPPSGSEPASPATTARSRPKTSPTTSSPSS